MLYLGPEWRFQYPLFNIAVIRGVFFFPVVQSYLIQELSCHQSAALRVAHSSGREISPVLSHQPLSPKACVRYRTPGDTVFLLKYRTESETLLWSYRGRWKKNCVSWVRGSPRTSIRSLLEHSMHGPSLPPVLTCNYPGGIQEKKVLTQRSAGSGIALLETGLQGIDTVWTTSSSIPGEYLCTCPPPVDT